MLYGNFTDVYLLLVSTFCLHNFSIVFAVVLVIGNVSPGWCSARHHQLFLNFPFKKLKKLNKRKVVIFCNISFV
jgi:hypothetical protein